MSVKFLDPGLLPTPALGRVCARCASGWMRDDGMVACGAGVDDEALALGIAGRNPVWAERMYGLDRMRRMFAGDAREPAGADCESLAPFDGGRCAVWRLGAPMGAESEAASLRSAIKRAAELWLRDPETMPAGMRISVDLEHAMMTVGSRLEPFAAGPAYAAKAYLEAAAAFIAPDWDVLLCLTITGESDVVLVRRRGDAPA